MTDPMMQQITERVADEIRDSATSNDARAAELRGEATQHRARAAELRTEADGLEQRAKDAEANAATWEMAAQIKRQEAAAMLGRPELPTPGMIAPVGELGMAVGALRMVPRPDASPSELESYRDLMESVYTHALTQMNRACDVLRRAQATIETGQLPEEFLPVPDPLSASPAEESGAHQVPAGFGPPQVAVVEGTSGTGAAHIAVERPAPDADATCEYCLAALVRVDGTWLHAETGLVECGTDTGSPLQANPVDVTYRGGDDADAPEPGRVAEEPPADPKPDTARRGMRRIARTGRRPKPARTPDASPYTSFGGHTGHTPDRMVAGPATGAAWESRAYPDAPANGGPVERERGDDPSALSLDGEITQAFPAPVTEDEGRQS